jgi:hypothetical protein
VVREEEVLAWQSDLRDWASSLHRRRLERAFLDASRLFQGDSERLLHAFSRLGIWASELSTAIDRGEADSTEVREHLERLGQFGAFAFRARPADQTEVGMEPER